MSRKTLKSLHQLYAEHTGKVSDKWSLYLTEYDRLFDDYRNKPIRLLEIGIQNGGSLDIWSKYFSNATVLIGCDINPDCARLSYDDPRIGVFVGDANAPDISELVFQRSPQFDIIIDDGSHLSSDIIKSFALYFPRLVEGGIFIAEDLHCSYWEQLEGGLFDPYSSISFFKHLADVINHEHWGVPRERADILRGSFRKYGCEVDEETLSQVHSVEFINSMCVVRKASAVDNGLGCRVIAGSMELVVSGHLELHGDWYQLDSTMYDQTNNPWTARTTPPDEAIQDIELSFGNAQQQISILNQAVAERDGQIANLNQTVAERDGQIAYLKEIVTKRNKLIGAMYGSTSWRVTLPLRFIGYQIRRARRISELAIPAIKLGGGLKKTTKKAIKLYRNEGLAGIKRGFRLVANLNSKTQVLQATGLSQIHFKLDKPKKGFNIVDGSFVISGWAVDFGFNAAAKIRIRIGKDIFQPHLKQRQDVKNAFASKCDLPLDVGFTAVPSLSLGLHRMWIDVKGPDNIWIPVRHALLFRLPKFMIRQPKPGISYKEWTHFEQKRLKVELPEIKRHINVMLYKPMFTVVIDTRRTLVGWDKSLQSIRKQIYPHYKLCTFAKFGTKLPSALKQNTTILQDLSLTDELGDFIVFIESGQSLSSNALYEFANAINQDPEIDLIYGDEDHFNASGERCNPFYKPDWSPDYLESFNYIGFPTCFRTKIVSSCLDSSNLYDLTLRFTELTSKIWHVTKILGHEIQRQFDSKTLECDTVNNIAALQRRLDRTGRIGKVREHELHHGCFDIQLDLKCEPLVSIIIPTAGKTVTVGERQIDLITNVINQIRNQSTYKNIEIIVIDNGDLSKNQQHILTDQGCSLITYTEPVFNISKKLNLGASIATGELFLLMNDDIEILTPSWIERMIEHFEKPHVGVVGAKLLYPDGLTQHVGVVHNSGNPDHVRRLFPGDEAGYYFSTCGVRNFMAVTGAIMMTLSNIYREVGGYSEELAVSYNDADYCLKVQEKGHWIVYAPKVELTHMESLSRVASADMSEVAWCHKRWASHIVSDPYYNEQFLTVASPTFEPYVNLRIL